MIYGVYAMRDVKTGFLPVSCDTNDQTAVRNFVHAVVNSDGVLLSFASDFSLYRVGDYDADSGHITSLDVPKHLFEGADALRAISVQGGSDK